MQKKYCIVFAVKIWLYNGLGTPQIFNGGGKALEKKKKKAVGQQWSPTHSQMPCLYKN